MTTVSSPPAPPAVDSFEARCRRMRLLAWEFDPHGHVTSTPRLSPELLPLFSSSRFMELLAATARQMIASPAPEPENISDGLWSIPVLMQRRRKAVGLCLVLGIEPEFHHSALFRQICAERRLAPAAAQSALEPITRSVAPCVADLHSTLQWMHEDMRSVTAARSTLNEFSTNLAQSYEQVNFVFRLARYLNVVEKPIQLIELLLGEIRATLPFSWVALRFIRQRDVIPELGGALMFHGESPHRDAIGEAALAMVNSASDAWTKILTPADHPLAALCDAEILAEPILHDQQMIGVLLAGNKTGEDPDLASTDIQLLDAISNFFGVFHENIARFTEQRGLFLGSLHALTSAIDAKDHYTRGHSERVGLLASQMARAMGMPDKIVEQYRIAGLVHDVGKIGVPEAVLKKTTSLTDDEFAEIKKHPALGHEMLQGILPLEPILPGVLHHHERWDGRGYPCQVAGQDIAMIARVLALADTFDAMSSNRAYRTSRTREFVFAEIRRNAGKQFDPAIVEQFLALDFTEFDAHLARVSAP